MQLKNDLGSQNLLNRTIRQYYESGNRTARNFLSSQDDEGTYYTYFLVDRKHPIRYSIGLDRNVWLGALELGIGPHYFGPAAFWSYDNYKRFSMDATTESVERNLSLLDEFLNLKLPKQ